MFFEDCIKSKSFCVQGAWHAQSATRLARREQTHKPRVLIIDGIITCTFQIFLRLLMRRIPTRTNASWHSVVCPPKKDNGYQKPRTAAQLANIASWRLIKQVPGQSAVQVINATLGISAVGSQS